MSGIYYDEHREYQMDLRETIWSTDALHELYKDTIGGGLSDVDWIGETENEIYLIELKNPKFVQNSDLCMCKGCDCDACKAEAKECTKCNKTVIKKAIKKDNKSEFIEKVEKKYYGSAFYLSIIGKLKPVKYYCVVDHPLVDSVWRNRATASIKRRLPFELQERNNIIKLIEDFRVLSVEDWNDSHRE